MNLKWTEGKTIFFLSYPSKMFFSHNVTFASGSKEKALSPLFIKLFSKESDLLDWKIKNFFSNMFK